MPKISMQQWAEKRRKLAERFWPAVRRGMKAGALRGVTVLQQATESAPPASPNGSVGAFDRGNYKRSWKQQVGQNFILLYNVAPYAGVIEYGRRPGRRQPPTAAILPWVRRKMGLRGSEAKGVAFLVARAIGRRGLRGRKVLIRAMPAIQRVIEDEIGRELAAELHK